jgi:pimeloyl-ACP methyl ester carboxylesterase
MGSRCAEPYCRCPQRAAQASRVISQLDRARDIRIGKPVYNNQGMPMSFVAQSIEVNGASVALKRGGAGEPLLFLHGADGLPEWPAILDDLAQSYDVIVPDLPGFGRSPCPEWIDDVSDVAYFYLDLIDALGLKKLHLAGHSLGGWAALEMAIRSCAQIRSVTLLASAGIHVKGAAKADIYMIDPDQQAKLAYADAAQGEAAAQRALATKHQEQAVLNRLASARFGWSPRLYNPRLARWLHRVKAPTLIIWGDTDRIIPPIYGTSLNALLPGSRLEIIPHCGHLPHVERRADVLRLMQNFMRASV